MTSTGRGCAASWLLSLALLGTGSPAGAQVQPTLTISDASVVEGNAGTTLLRLRVGVDRPLASPVTGVVSVIPLSGAGFRPAIRGQACGAPGVDFAWPADGQFQLGQTASSFPGVGGTLVGTADPSVPPWAELVVSVCTDAFTEPDEHLYVRLLRVQGAQCLEGTCDAIGTIRNDGDAAPMPASTLAVADVSVTEPVTGTRNLTFVVSLGSASLNPIAVEYRTTDGTARATAAGTGPWTCPQVDYFSRSGRLEFASGDVQKTVTTSVCGGDSNAEGSETFFLDLANASGTQIVDPRGIATIREGGLQIRSQLRSAASTSSSIFFASPNSIRLFSL